MATFSQNDITLLFVGGAATKTTSSIGAMNQYEIGIFTPAGTRITELTAATVTEFIVVQSRGANAAPIVSPVIKKADVVKATRKTYVAATEQVDYIGYNTSSGSIEAINDNIYRIRLAMDESLTSNKGRIYVKDGVYQSDSTATQVEIANGLVTSLINNFKREPEKAMKFERVTNSTIATGTLTTGTLDVRYGSPYVTAASDIDNSATGTTMVVGDYLVILGVAYKVIALDNTNQIATLDVPYQGTTNSAVPDANVTFIPAANAAAGNWGIKITGRPLTFSVGKIKYRKSRWVTSIQDFGTTTITNSVGASEGTGTTEQAQEKEWFYRGNDSEIFRMGEPNIYARIADVVVGTNYDSIILNVEETGSSLVMNKRKKQIELLLPETAPNYAVTGTADDITDVLEVLIYGSANGNLAI